MSVTIEKLARYLEGLARSGETASYTDVTRRFDLPPPHPWEKHVLSELFALLDEEDATAHRPFRTAMVILKGGDGLPGRGFFYSLERFKGEKNTKETSDQKRLHQRELDGVVALYRSID